MELQAKIRNAPISPYNKTVQFLLVVACFLYKALSQRAKHFITVAFDN